MNNIEAKIKSWIELIQQEKLSDVTKDIQAHIVVKEGKINKHFFKLLLYLSHTADKCDKQNHIIGKDIWKLTCTLCSTLTEIPDNVKFVSSLFHIIRCLLTMHMYNEAYKVCLYLKVEIFCYDQDNVNDLLVKIAYLWYNATNNEFLVLQNDPSSFTDCCKLESVVRYELEVIKITHENFTKHILRKISSYLDKIALINKTVNFFTNFSTFINEYLDQTELFLNRDDKNVICRYMFHIISRIICENINNNSIQYSTVVLNNIFINFEKVLLEDEECYQSLKLFRDVCQTLVQPIECFEQSSIRRIKKLSDIYIILTKRYGYLGSIKWANFSIVQILEPLFLYWESYIKTGLKKYPSHDVILEILNLVEHISSCFVKQTLSTCKSCQSEDCLVRMDLYNAVVMKTRFINLISKFSTNDLSRNIFACVRKFLEKNVAFIYQMKECKCKSWTQLWSTNSALIYNLGIMSDCFYEESVSLFSLLLTSIIQFEGIQLRSKYINLENPVCFILHRISFLHYSHAMYREAMTATALNALLSYKNSESKAFRMWANIKHKSVSSKELMEVTMIHCLKKDKSKVEELGISIDLSKYDLLEICLREAKGLQEAKVNLSVAIIKILTDMKILNATPIQYARVVQMLVYHLLSFNNEDDHLEYVKQAIYNLQSVEQNCSVLCLKANLEFYIFINQLYVTSKKTQIEMENAKFALCIPKVNEIGETESRDVVPTYSMINIKEDSRLMTYLLTPLKKWEKCLKQSVNKMTHGYEPMITLHTLIIAGEYAHLYRYQECEFRIWNLVYTLASEIKDNSAIVYATARCVALRYINNHWITMAMEIASKLGDTASEDFTYAIATFWISLSDFYFECNLYDEAKHLLNKARKLPGISFFNNISLYLYILDRTLYNYHLNNNSVQHEEYTRCIVETLYTMVNLNEELSARKWKQQDRYLFGFDILLSATVNLSLRMNSLLSFREISAHLIRRLRTAQALGASLRVAEILKSFCYIDLSRAQLSGCEIKLQGLEYILNIEAFQASMNSLHSKTYSENVSVTPIRTADSIRDLPQNDTSPILRQKVFDLPKFMYHKECTCYMCQNVSYHYLVFISTHIRAQLYALQKNISASSQHFHGAFQVMENLVKQKNLMKTHKKGYVPWQERFYAVDYVLLLINFSYFIRNYLSTRDQRILKTILLIAQICDTYKLNSHPIHMAVTELMLDYRFLKIYDVSYQSKFTVFDASDINISKYTQEQKAEESICVTPTTNNTRVKQPIALRRNRTPPLLQLTKVNMDFSDDEDDTVLPTEYKKREFRSRLIRRKILDNEYLENNEKEEMNKGKNDLSVDWLEISNVNLHSYSIKDIIMKVASLAPDISEYLYRMVDKLDEPATTKNVQKLINTIENLKLNTVPQRSVRKTRQSKELPLNDSNKINEVIALFKDFDINEQKRNSPNKINVAFERRKESLPSIKKDSQLSQRQSRVSDEGDTEQFEYNTSLKVNNSKKTLTTESARLRITRNSTKHTVINKESHNIKTKKSREKLT